jgi:peptidyl-prolyl cis-trans isomerase B (cyclophilin B)
MNRFSLVLIALLLIPSGALLQADEVVLMQLKFATRKGYQPVAFELYEADAPGTVENFKKLVRKGFYKGIAFHRAFPNVLVQAGDPYSRKKDRVKVGTGGPGYTIPPEVRRKHTVGAVAMARLPDKINPSRVSNGSQFFVCLAPMPSYDGQYTVFGRVLYGMETLGQISNLPVDSNDYPLERVTIRSAKVLPREKLPAAPAAPGAPAAPTKKAWWKIF